MGEVFWQVAPGVTAIVLISVMILPMAIWDSRTGRYRGYLNWRAGSVLLLTAMYFGYLSYIDGDDAWAMFSSVCSYLGQAVVGSRIFVELCNYSLFKVWMHRRYHKLTGHEDRPWGTVPAVASDFTGARTAASRDTDESTN